jgi:hypothetical protein
MREIDKNGKKIYEGDIVNVNHYGGTPKYETIRFYTIAGFAGIHPFTDSGYHWVSHRCDIGWNSVARSMARRLFSKT